MVGMRLVLRVELLEPLLGFLDHVVCVPLAQFDTGAVPDYIGRVLEVAQRRIDWLESLKADPEARAKLSESTGIDLTIEAIDAIIEATRQEVIYIEKQIQLLQDGTQALSKPVFWAETGNFDSIHHVDYGASLLSIGVDSLAHNDKQY